jgi:hypothetical protein
MCASRRARFQGCVHFPHTGRCAKKEKIVQESAGIGYVLDNRKKRISSQWYGRITYKISFGFFGFGWVEPQLQLPPLLSFPMILYSKYAFRCWTHVQTLELSKRMHSSRGRGYILYYMHCPVLCYLDSKSTRLRMIILLYYYYQGRCNLIWACTFRLRFHSMVCHRIQCHMCRIIFSWRRSRTRTRAGDRNGTDGVAWRRLAFRTRFDLTWFDFTCLDSTRLGQVRFQQ